MSLNRQPNDVLVYLLTFVDIPELFILSWCSKRFFNLANIWYLRYSQGYLDKHNYINMINKLPYHTKDEYVTKKFGFMDNYRSNNMYNTKYTDIRLFSTIFG